MLDIDALIVIGFLAITLIVGIYAGRKVQTLKDFAITHRNYSTPVIVATLFATVIGGGSTFGVAEKAFSVGIIYILAFYGAALNKILVSKFIAPNTHLFSDCIGVGDIIGRLYGRRARVLAGVAIILVSIASVGSQVKAMGHVLNLLTGIPFLWAVLIGCSIFIVYSAFGGIRAVVATDVLQFMLLIIFVPMVCNVALNIIGGPTQILSAIPTEKLSLFQDKSIILECVSFFLVLTFSALDPSFIQRLLLSKSPKQAILSTRITGILSIPFFTIMGGIGIIAFTINPEINANYALPFLIKEALPVGLKGLAIMGLVSAVMSTADSDLHVVGLAAIRDIIAPLYKKEVSQKMQLRIAQLSTLFLGVFSVITALHFKSIIQIMLYAFGFWGPTVLVPIIFAFRGIKTDEKTFFVSCSAGLISQFAWNYFLDWTHVDGLIPGMFLNVLIFVIMGKIRVKDFKKNEELGRA